MRRPTLFLLCLLGLALLDSLGRRTSAAAPAAAIADWRFGVIESYEDPAAANELGIAWTRVQFNWAETQLGGADTWTSKVSDAQINAEINAGRMVVGLLIGIPDWAKESNGLPRGLWLSHTDPGNTWAVFVREAVTRYQGRIDHWVIWNEPDIDSGAIAHTWSGTVDDFFQLQRTAYLVAKETNPASVIHLAAFTYWADVNARRQQYMARLLDLILADPAAAGHNYYFDVATAHLYFQPNQIFDLLQYFLRMMRGRGMNQPIWLMETNVPPFDDPYWPVASPLLKATLEEQAAFMPQALASALAAGAERIAIYKMKDTPSDRDANPEPFGLVRRDNSRRPAFTTYGLAMRYMSGITSVRRERWDEVGQIRLDQWNQSTTVLFARLPYPQLVQVPATAHSAMLVDMWGNQREIAAADGVFSVNLPAAACSQSIGDYCMVGGATYYLVQLSDGQELAGTPAAATTLSAIPTVTDTPIAASPETETPTDTPAPTATAKVTLIPSATSTATSTTSASIFTPSVTATAVTAAQVMPSPASGVSGNDPDTPDEKPVVTQYNLAYWFLGAGFLLAVGLAISQFRRGRRP